MGVDYYTCTICDETFPDCGYFVSCKCGYSFCSDICGKPIKNNKNHIVSCILCRKETATDSEILIFLLKHFNLSWDEAFEIYKNKI